MQIIASRASSVAPLLYAAFPLVHRQAHYIAPRITDLLPRSAATVLNPANSSSIACSRNRPYSHPLSSTDARSTRMSAAVTAIIDSKFSDLDSGGNIQICRPDGRTANDAAVCSTPVVPLPGARHRNRTLDDLMRDPEHDCYYFVDHGVIAAYYSHEIPSLNRYIDMLSLKGRRFFASSRVVVECTVAPLPSPFHIHHDDDALIRADLASSDLFAEFGISADASNELFKNGVRWILESGFCMCSCDYIPVEDVIDGRAFALTLNATLIRRFLETPDNRCKVETIIDQHALEHLATVRLLGRQGDFEDVCNS